MPNTPKVYFARTGSWIDFKGGASGGSGGVDPIVTGQTRFGFNTMIADGDAYMTQFGKVPVARCYTSSLPSNGSLFAPGGLCYKAAGLHLAGAGVLSGKRVNMSFSGWSAPSVTSTSSAVANEVRNFVLSIPADWQVQLVLAHEYNLDSKRGLGTIAQFVNAIKILGEVIGTADPTGQKCFAVINPSADVGWLNSYSPTAGQMPEHTEFHWDIYDQPKGIGGLKAYGALYGTPSALCADRMQSVIDLGFMSANYGWGIDEMGATQRVAPKLATINTTLGWGPNSPADLDATQRVASIKGMTDFYLSQPIKPSTILHFTFGSTGTGQWNHSWKTGGRHDRGGIPTDDWYMSGTTEVRGPNYQNFPINLSTAATNRLMAMVQANIDSSPL